MHKPLAIKQIIGVAIVCDVDSSIIKKASLKQ